jgi:hypothetical protein
MDKSKRIIFYSLLLSLTFCVVLIVVVFGDRPYSADARFQKNLGCEVLDYDRGPLIIKSGSTISLAAGENYVYSSILIHKGATLQFTGDTIKNYTVLRSRGDFIVEGTIRAQGFSLAVDKQKKSQHTYSQWIGTECLLHTYGEIQEGGKGGAGGRVNECHPKSCFRLSCVGGKPGSAGCGGQGGAGMSRGQIVACKYKKGGKDCYLVTEFDSDTTTMTGCKPCGFKYNDEEKLSPGKGGNGGSSGKFGGLLYLVSCENFTGDRGIVDVSGSQGVSGKPGASDRYTGGGGGGGGPGGNGGSVYFNVKGNLSLPTVKINGGPGGKGGAGGNPHSADGLSSYIGSTGEQGENGLPGHTVIINEIHQDLISGL